jgi:hypothetical protein
MKKLLALFLVAGIIPALTLAGEHGNHPMAGCGLGYLLLSNKDNSKVNQVLGATTNGTFGTQTFGISSGTSGCTEDGAVKLTKAAEVFAEVNFDSLRRDMAMGHGEFVNSFASLLGVPESKRPALFQLFQERYLALFPSPQTTSAEMLGTLSRQLNLRPELIG